MYALLSREELLRMSVCPLFGLVLTGGRSRPVPFEFKAVPRFAETKGILKEALELFE